MSPSTTTPPALIDRVRTLILNELPSVRLDRGALEDALKAGEDARIPSRKAMVIIARVCHKLGVGNVIKKSDLKPKQVTNLESLIDLIATRSAPKLPTP